MKNEEVYCADVFNLHCFCWWILLHQISTIKHNLLTRHVAKAKIRNLLIVLTLVPVLLFYMRSPMLLNSTFELQYASESHGLRHT